MPPRLRLILLVCLLAGVALSIPTSRFGGSAPASLAGGAASGADYRVDPGEAEAAGARRLTAGLRRASFTFEPATAAADRALFTAAVAAAHPEARRLVALVDGLTRVQITTTPPEALGLTSDRGPRYLVAVDLGRVLRLSGRRGVDRVVLHELAHVLDRALVTDDTMSALQAAIPAGWGCDQGHSGACAPAEERFAETFAKWATGDIGVDLPMGYKVPPPSLPLDLWAQPLSRVGA
jgi:hypothetical protein